MRFPAACGRTGALMTTTFTLACDSCMTVIARADAATSTTMEWVQVLHTASAGRGGIPPERDISKPQLDFCNWRCLADYVQARDLVDGTGPAG